MITVGRLKRILAQIPDEAQAVACEGEDTGLSISCGASGWFIRATGSEEEDDNDDDAEFFVDKYYNAKTSF